MQLRPRNASRYSGTPAPMPLEYACLGLRSAASIFGHGNMKQRFKARLEGRGPSGAWTFLPIPFHVESVFGRKARVPVSGTINGHPFRNSLMPEGDGSHSMMVSKELQGGAAASKGDVVAVVIDIDRKKRTVVLPVELKAALDKAPAAKHFFEQLSPSCKKEYADWIGTAKREETRSVRATRAIGLLSAKKKLR